RGSAVLIVHGQAEIGPDIRERWLEATRPTLEASRAAPGNAFYFYAADLFAPSSFHVLQLWEDQASFDAHLADPHHRARLAALDEMGGRWSTVTHYEIAEVRRKR